MILNLGIQCMEDCFADHAEDCINSDWEEIWAAVGIEPPHPDESDNEDIAYHLQACGKSGYLVRFATPIPRDITTSSFRFSWGMYTTQWIYSETIQDACNKAIEWRRGYIEKERAKAA